MAIPDGDGTVFVESGIIRPFLWTAALRAVQTGGSGFRFGFSGAHGGGCFSSDVLHNEESLPHPLGLSIRNRTKGELFSENRA